MNDLTGQTGKLEIVVTVKRKATGKEEKYYLVSVVAGEDAEKAQHIVKMLNKPKERDDGDHTLDSK